MAELRLAVNTCFAVKNWPMPADWLGIVRGWGVERVQFSVDLLDPFMPGASRAAEEIREQAVDHGISIDSTFTGACAYHSNLLSHPDARYRAHALNWYRGVVKLSAAMGAGATGGHMGALSAAEAAAPALRSERLTGLAQAIGILGADAGRRGLKMLLWELMPSACEPPHTPAEASELLARANELSPVPVRLCFDLGHACAPDVLSGSGPDPETVYRWLAELLPVTPMVHLQQTDGLGDRHWPFAGDYQRQGIIEPARVREVLSASPLPGVDLVLEILHPPEAGQGQILDDWARSIERWR
ncbi:MAG: TIM barrel protein [Bacillota bacterium]|nr:TIM barrel protein [Bacillota bacterium]